MLSVIGIALATGAAPVLAQSNLDAGKSPAQIFSDTCNACHRNAREIKPASAAFLREHYTTGPREAAAMAGYLASVGSDPNAVKQRRPPAMGAGQAPTEPKPAQAPAQSTATAATPAPSAPIPNGATAGSPAPSAEAAAKPNAALPTTRPRRPSDSIEVGSLPGSERRFAERPCRIRQVQVMGDAELVQDLDRYRPMPQRAEMQPVLRPHQLGVLG